MLEEEVRFIHLVVGCELSGEIKHYYPDKAVTLVNSRTHLLPNNDVSNATRKRLESKLSSLGIQLIMNDKIQRLGNENIIGAQEIQTEQGRLLTPDLLFFSTGQRKPNTGFLEELGNVLTKKGEVRVNSKLQIDEPSLSHIFW